MTKEGESEGSKRKERWQLTMGPCTPLGPGGPVSPFAP